MFKKLKAKRLSWRLKCEVLEQAMKGELYKEFINKLGEPMEMARLKKENKKLRNKVKTLQEIIRNGE